MADNKVKLLNFNELGLDYGQSMTLLPKPSDTSVSYEAVFVGCVPNESVVMGAGSGVALPTMAENQKVVIRACLPGGVALFPTLVQAVVDRPTQMVLFEFPRDIKFKQVRSATRVNVVMPILVSNKNNVPSQMGLAGKVLDISASGARIEVYDKLGDVGDEVLIKGKFRVDKIARLLSLNSIIRMYTPIDGGHVYGVEFCEADENNLLVLFGFIYHEIAFGEQQIVK